MEEADSDGERAQKRHRFQDNPWFIRPLPPHIERAEPLACLEIDRNLLQIEENLFTGKYRNSEVCIKLLKDLQGWRLKDFAEIRKLSHDNVIKIIGISTEPLNPLVVLEPICSTLFALFCLTRLLNCMDLVFCGKVTVTGKMI